jgi:hypothetical protein
MAFEVYEAAQIRVLVFQVITTYNPAGKHQPFEKNV